jgi:hypothetical protein
MATVTRTERAINRYGDKQRWYSVPGVGQLPSVTTVLGCINKPALAAWSARVEREMVLRCVRDVYKHIEGPLPSLHDFMDGLEHALGREKAHTKELKKATDIGTEAHQWVEWSLCRELGLPCGSEPPLSDPAAKATRAWKLWREEVEFEPIAVESTLYSISKRYAGTMDFLASMKHEGQRITVLGDIKTGSAIYREAKMQASAYVNAAVEMDVLPEPVPALIVRLPKKGPEDGFETALVSVKDQVAYFRAFLSALTLFNALEIAK